MSERKNKPGEGALFRNNDAHPHPKAPGYRGRMTCPCCEEELKLSAWVRTSESGVQYMRLNIDQHQAADKNAQPNQEQQEDGRPF